MKLIKIKDAERWVLFVNDYAYKTLDRPELTELKMLIEEELNKYKHDTSTTNS